MCIIDTLALTNKLRDTHPAEKMLFALLTLFGVLLTDSVWLLAAILGLMALFTLVKIGTPARIYRTLLLIPAVFIVMGLVPLIIEIGSSGAPAWLSFRVHAVRVRITPSGAAQAGRLFLKSFASITCFYALALSTPVNDILYVLGRLGISATLLEMMALVYRYIGTLLETAQNMYASQRNRLGYRSFGASLRSLGLLMSALVVRSFARSETAYNALLSRCYRGDIATLKEVRPVNVRSLAAIACFELAFLAAIVSLWGH